MSFCIEQTPPISNDAVVRALDTLFRSYEISGPESCTGVPGDSRTQAVFCAWHAI
jgi:hypothetical protein